jgi:hypothetical protein
MTTFKYTIIILIGISLTALLAFSSEKKENISMIESEKNDFVVLELFTSQGCSSCPSADKLLAKTYEEAQKNHKQIFVLSYHVDYWDRLGWKDPFSQSLFTKRQYNYAKLFGLQGVYTPQVVVNGAKEFVGSDARKLNSALENNANQKTKIDITLEDVKWLNGQVSFRYNLKGDFKNSQLQVAILSKKEETNIPRGENSGLKLSGSNIVRALQTLKSSEKSTFNVTLPKDLDKENTRIVVFAQDLKSLQVIGVEGFDF